MNPNYPYGKWWFYEPHSKVPLYFIFYPDYGGIRGISPSFLQNMRNMTATTRGALGVDALSLFLGVWQGTKADRTGYWLRWWDPEGKSLALGG